jgi:hypothetical protein
MNMEFIQWPKFMPQFYTAPNANLRFKNEYNYDIANSFSIAHSGKNSRFSFAETADI